MRSTLVLSAAAILMAATTSHASDNAQVAEAVKREIFKKTRVTATQIKDRNLATCFAAFFYSISIEKDAGGGGTETSQAVYMKTAKGLEEASKPCTNEAVPALQRAINPRFRLANDATGVCMLAALKAIYVDRGSFGRKFEPVVVHKGNTWNFILGEFLGGKFSGFVMTTDAQGRITNVSYSLGIVK